MKKLLAIALVVLTLLSVGCKPKGPTYVDGTARYTTDTTLGSGSKTITVTVKENEEFTVVFTIKTDGEILGDILTDLELIAGDAGPYGLYLKVVNGLRADYDKDKAFWAFYINGESATTGLDGEKIADGKKYELVYTIG